MGKLSSEEIALERYCMDFALQHGASKVRITLTKSLLNLIGVLNGEIDKTSLAIDRSIQLAIFAGGRFGTFSSNRLEKEELERFILGAIDTVRMLEEDPLRDLPAKERLEKGATSGLELGLYDPQYTGLDAGLRREMALDSMEWPRKAALEKGFTLISEEGEYSDSLFDSLTIDSQGLYARHTETSFEIGYECTVADSKGNHYASYWWDAAPFLKDLHLKGCSAKAVERAASQIGPKGIKSGKYTVVVESECASRLLSPVLNALGGFALQQNNSFLVDSLGKKLFHDNLTVLDLPHVNGQTGSRLFDSEGVSTPEGPIIENGVVKRYFLSTYMAAKMQMEPTCEDSTRACIVPTGGCETLEQLLQKAGDCILVTGFNGGNSSPVSGNFSYGIEGFLVKGGKIVHPVKEMLMTGNLISLWNSLLATADDSRPCMSRDVPSLAFSKVDISA